LVSDPDTNNASAAMSVNIGSFSNPPDLSGLVYTLEHMLFIGTRKVQRVCLISFLLQYTNIIST
jgi:insulysin